jgi:MazG family protein
MTHAQPSIERLLAIMAALRDPKTGCPWDREQTFATIAPYTIEEAYEVAEAIRENDLTALKDELGDLLFQVVFYAQMASESGGFTFEAIATAVSDKMVRRHPHVFGTAEIASSEAQTRNWETIKAHERTAKAAAANGAQAPDGALAGVSRALPGLTRALKLQARAARVGFDWAAAAPIFAKIAEEVAELEAAVADRAAAPAAVEAELGDLLFACVNLARHLSVDPEASLRRANAKFERRFRTIEAALAAEGRTPGDASLAEMDALWDRAKADEKSDSTV